MNDSDPRCDYCERRFIRIVRGVAVCEKHLRDAPDDPDKAGPATSPQTVDAARFRRSVLTAVARLRAMPSLDPNTDRITEGRVSGAHLALSYLDESVVRDA